MKGVGTLVVSLREGGGVNFGSSVLEKTASSKILWRIDILIDDNDYSSMLLMIQ